MKLKFTLSIILIAFLSFYKTDAFAYQTFDAVIHTTDGHRFQGHLIEVTNKGVTISLSKVNMFFDKDSILSIKIKHKNSTQKLMRFTGYAGLAAGVLFYNNQHEKHQMDVKLLPIIGVGGFVIGEAFGAMLNAFGRVDKFKKVASTYDVILPKLSKYAAPRIIYNKSLYERKRR